MPSDLPFDISLPRSLAEAAMSGGPAACRPILALAALLDPAGLELLQASLAIELGAGLARACAADLAAHGPPATLWDWDQDKRSALATAISGFSEAGAAASLNNQHIALAMDAMKAGLAPEPDPELAARALGAAGCNWLPPRQRDIFGFALSPAGMSMAPWIREAMAPLSERYRMELEKAAVAEAAGPGRGEGKAARL